MSREGWPTVAVFGETKDRGPFPAACPRSGGSLRRALARIYPCPEAGRLPRGKVLLVPARITFTCAAPFRVSPARGLSTLARARSTLSASFAAIRGDLDAAAGTAELALYRLPVDRDVAVLAAPRPRSRRASAQPSQQLTDGADLWPHRSTVGGEGKYEVDVGSDDGQRPGQRPAGGLTPADSAAGNWYPTPRTVRM